VNERVKRETSIALAAAAAAAAAAIKQQGDKLGSWNGHAGG